MEIAVLSDLHIKYRDKTQDSYSDEFISKVLFELVNDIKINKVVLNGDVFELLQGKCYPTVKQQLKEFDKIKKAYPKTLSLIFNNDKIEILVGNHDKVLLHLFPEKVKEYAIIENCYFNHGNFDFVNGGKHYKLGEFLSWIAGWLERLFGKKADTKLERKISNWSKDPLSNKKQIKYALKLSKKIKSKFIILSHTHQYQVKDMGNFIFINTGCFKEGKKDVIIIDTKKNDYIKLY